MLKNIDQGLTWTWPSEGFFRGTLGDFSKIFLGKAKSGKIVFFPTRN